MSPLTCLIVLSFLVCVDVRILVPLLPSISYSFEASPGAVGLAMTTYSLAYGIGQLFYGPLSDRLGRIAVVRAAGVGFSVCTVLSALCRTPLQFVLVRLLAGALAGAVIPLTLMHIGDTVAYDRRQTVLGRFAVITSAALAFSAAIGGTISHFISWRMMLLGYGLLALIPVGMLWRFDFRGADSPGPCSDRFGDLLSNRYAVFVYVGVFLEGFLCWGGMTYLGAYAAHRFILDQFTVGLLIALFGIGMMVGGMLMDRIRRVFSENALALAGGILMGGAFLALLLRGRPLVFAACMFVLGLGYVSLHTTLQLRGTAISSTARGKAFALFGVSLFGGLSAGSAAFAFLVNAERYEAMFSIVGAGLIGIGAATALAPQRSAMPMRVKEEDGTCVVKPGVARERN